jgi:hypothetical protein
MLVYLLCRHLEEERLNTAARAGAYALQRIFPLEVFLAEAVTPLEVSCAKLSLL